MRISQPNIPLSSLVKNSNTAFSDTSPANISNLILNRESIRPSGESRESVKRSGESIRPFGESRESVRPFGESRESIRPSRESVRRSGESRESVRRSGESRESVRRSVEESSDQYSNTSSVEAIDNILKNAIKQKLNAEEQETNAMFLKQQVESQKDKRDLRGGRQLDYNNYKNNAHINVSDYITQKLSKYENTDSDTSVFLENMNNKLNNVAGGYKSNHIESDTAIFLQNINNKINELKGSGNVKANNSETDTSIFLQNINNKLNELTGGNNNKANDNIEINSSVSTEHFLNYIENKLNNNLEGGDINNILQDSFIKGMNEGGYLNKKKTKISQQDILNRIKMSGGGGSKDDSSDSDSDSESDSESNSDSSQSSNKKPYTHKKNKSDSNDSIGGSDTESDEDTDSEEDSDKDTDEDTETDEDNNFQTKHGEKKPIFDGGSEDSLSSIIISSGENSETPYMISDSLNTEDINLVSFSSPKKPKRSTKKSSKKSSKKSKK
jgi:hypothetical protein